MARPKFEPTDEIRDVVRNGAMIGSTWDQIATMATLHLQDKYKEAVKTHDRLSKSNAAKSELPVLSSFSRSVSKIRYRDTIKMITTMEDQC